MQRTADSIYELKGLGVSSFLITDEHPLYVLRDGKAQWVKTKDLKTTDMFLFNVNQESIDVPYSKELMWLLGRYVADGHYNKLTYHSINFSIAFKKEEEFLNNIPQEYKEKFKKFKKKCWDYRIADRDLQELCLQFNTGSSKKEIPKWVIDLPKEKLQAFFDGYMAGDGFKRKKSNSSIEYMFSTTSQKLYLGLQQIVAKLYGKIPSCYIRKDNRKKSFNDSYSGQFSIGQPVYQQQFEDKIATRIKEIKLINSPIEVFNIEVEEDNSYTCSNVIVHNCQDLSKAGTMGGMEKGSGTRSGLLWEIERMLLELRDSNSPLPQVLLMENVPDVIGKRNRAHFNDWLNQLESLGYHNYYKILNTKNYGIPQNRERCFMFSILGDYYVDMPPKKLKLKYKLRDLLEKNVDKSFFLSEEKIKSIANWKAQQDPLKDIDKEKEISPTITARGAGEEHSGMVLINEDTIPIKNATHKGYLEAREGDGVDISSRMQFHRGTVQKGMTQTLTTAGGENVGVVVGTFNYAKSDNFMQGKDRFKPGKDIADCVLTEPKEGIVIQETPNLKAQMCNKLIEEGKVQEYDVIRHSYTNSRMNGEMKDIQQNDISPTLDTRCDCLGVVVSEGPKKDYSNEEPQVLAGLGEKKSNDGTQWYQQDRIYDDKVAISVTTAFNPYYATQQEETFVAAAQRGREDGQQLEISDREVANALTTVNKDSMVAQVTKIGNYSPSGHNAASIVDANGCAPTVMENHGTVTATKVGLHIRKLTPREAFRLQGVANYDIDKMAHYTNGNAYHLSGDSITCSTLMALFGELLDLDYTTLIEKFIEENIIEKNVIE